MAPSDDQPGPRKRRTPPLRFVSATDEPDNDEETRRPPNSFMIFRTCIEHASKTDPRMPDIPQSIFSVVMSIFWTWYKARDASNYIQQKAEQIAHEHRVENPHYMYTPRQHTSKQQETAEHKALVRRHKQEMQAVKNAGLDIEGTHLAKKPTKKGKHAKGKNRYYARHQEEVERVMEPWIHRMLEHYGIRDGVLPHSFLQKMEEVRQTNKMKKSASEKRNQDKVDREGKNNAAAAEKAGDTGPSPRLSLASLPKSSDIPSSFKLTESATPESSAGSPPRQSPLPRRKAARRKNYPGQGEFFTRSSSEGFNDLSPLEATARPSVPQASGQAQPSTPPRPQGITIPSIPSMHQPPSSSPREEEMSFLQSMPRFQCLNLQFPNLRDGFDVLANTGFTFGNDDQPQWQNLPPLPQAPAQQMLAPYYQPQAPIQQAPAAPYVPSLNAYPTAQEGVYLAQLDPASYRAGDFNFDALNNINSNELDVFFAEQFGGGMDTIYQVFEGGLPMDQIDAAIREEQKQALAAPSPSDLNRSFVAPVNIRHQPQFAPSPTDSTHSHSAAPVGFGNNVQNSQMAFAHSQTDSSGYTHTPNHGTPSYGGTPDYSGTGTMPEYQQQPLPDETMFDAFVDMDGGQATEAFSPVERITSPYVPTRRVAASWDNSSAQQQPQQSNQEFYSAYR